MSEEKRKLGDYEIIQSIYIGDKEVVFGVDKKDPYPFMVCCCDYHNPLSAAWPTEGVASDDYMEAMQIFVDRVQSQIDRTKAELAKFPFDKTVFTKEHCIPDGGKIIVTNSWGEKREYSCRFIDECHTEVGNNIFHICEFAERMQQNGATYEPKQAEQPPQKAPRKNDYER